MGCWRVLSFRRGLLNSESTGVGVGVLPLPSLLSSCTAGPGGASADLFHVLADRPRLSFMLPCFRSPAPRLLPVALPIRGSIVHPAAFSCVVGQKKSAGALLGFRRCSMRFSLFTFSRWRWLEVCGLFGRSLVRRPPVPKASALWDSSPNGRGNSWPCVGQRRPDSSDGLCCRERAPRRR